jgi:hypothetical protein
MATQNNGLGLVPSLDAQTAVAGAATSAAQNVFITSQSLTTATSWTLTLTDAQIAANSVVQVVAYNGVATGVQVASITVTAGQVVIVFDFASYTGTIKAMVSILS